MLGFNSISELPISAANALIAASQAHYTNLLLSSTILKTSTANSNLISKFQIDHAANIVKKASFNIVHSAEVLLRSSSTNSHVTDSILKVSLTRTTLTNILLKASSSIGHSAKVLLRSSSISSHVTDSILKISPTRTTLTNILLKASFTKTNPTNALKKASFLLTSSSNDLLVVSRLSTISASSLLSVSFKISSTQDTLLKVGFHVRTNSLIKASNNVSSAVYAVFWRDIAGSSLNVFQKVETPVNGVFFYTPPVIIKDTLKLNRDILKESGWGVSQTSYVAVSDVPSVVNVVQNLPYSFYGNPVKKQDAVKSGEIPTARTKISKTTMPSLERNQTFVHGKPKR